MKAFIYVEFSNTKLTDDLVDSDKFPPGDLKFKVVASYFKKYYEN